MNGRAASLNAASGLASTAPRAPRRAAMTPPRRSGITHISTANYECSTASSAAAEARVNADAPTQAWTSSARRDSRATTAPVLPAQRSASARRTSRSPSPPPELDPTPAALRPPPTCGRTRPLFTAFGSGSGKRGGEDVAGNVSWRQHVAAVCRRLEATVEETEQILMRVVGPTADMVGGPAPQSSSHRDHAVSNVGGDGLACSSAQAMDALVRYRSGCMAAMLELDALQRHHHNNINNSNNNTPAATSPQPPPTNDPQRCSIPLQPTAQSRDAEVVAALQERCTYLEARVTDTLATQAAYVRAVALQQQHREQEGVMGEYMWTARLLVEQEAEERAQLQALWAYLAASAPPPRWSAATAAVAPLPPPLPPSSPHGSTAAARLTTQNEALLRELHHTKERTRVLLQEQQRDLQAAQERALANLISRHAAEMAALEARAAQAAHRAADDAQRRRSGVEQESTAAASTNASSSSADSLVDSLQQQLKEATKKMWRLQLANDHLDAKTRVLERELEELRECRSPVRRRERSGSVTEQPGVSPHRAALALPRPALQLGGRDASNDVRYGQPLAASRRSSANSAQAVLPCVWAAYEERRGLPSHSARWASETPPQQQQQSREGGAPPRAPVINAAADRSRGGHHVPGAFERSMSPVRQLSLDRTPAAVEDATTTAEAPHSPSASAQTDASDSLRSGAYPPPPSALHGMGVSAADTDLEEEEEEHDESLAASSCTSPTASGSRARLEAVRRDILRHAERLELDVQAVTCRYDSARRQRRREKDTLRVNASVHSASNSPAASEPRDDARRHVGADGAVDGVDGADDDDDASLNCALEKLHVEQQEDDDELERYYADVNQKRAELERCLHVVEEKLASLP
ncbi:hypothetical protein NESM_000328300 [Novymonas esmeraldas]|uniref:Uncharacterized protein n=1 Tax=Novymonas esmeraldas TaxID=1808958 RepID=A0AAW0EJ90_9TRYP